MILFLTGKPPATNRKRSIRDTTLEYVSRAGIDYDSHTFQDIELLCTAEDQTLTVSEKPLSNWSTIVVREVGMYHGLAFVLASHAKKHGIKIVDEFWSNTNDLTKLVQAFSLSSHGIPIPKTYYTPLYSKAHLSHATEFLGFPVVIKRCNLSKGEGVTLAKDLDSLMEQLNRYTQQEPDREIILQEFTPNTYEYRVFVAGNTVASVERKERSEKEEFRNNVCLGAKEEYFDPSLLSDLVREAAIRAAQSMNIQMAGVDIMEMPDGSPIVFEVNSSPGFTIIEGRSEEISGLQQYLSRLESEINGTVQNTDPT